MKLEVSGLDAWYGPAQVLYQVSLQIAPGEVVALVGRNGTGKSTLLKSIMGLEVRRAGSVRFDGREVSRSRTYDIARGGLGYVPEERRIFTALTVDENLEAGRQQPRAGAPTWTPASLYGLFPSLGAMRTRLGAHMSGGEQQMLTIARTLMGNPTLVLMDEPTEGLAPKVVGELALALGEIKKQGVSLLIAEQNLRFLGALADRDIPIERGRVLSPSAGPDGAR